MLALTAAEIRDCFVNAGAIDTDRIPLPGLHEVLWDDREFLGWRDGSTAHRGYLVFWRGTRPVGIVLRAAETRLAGGSAMCSLCQITQPAGQVRMFTALRAGDAGHAGDSVGTYMCADLGCPHLIRIAPHGSPWDPNPEAVVAQRAEGLSRRLEAFAAKVLAAR
ncbi:FBP domain-containing protein [Protaetiibacter intestinalis]|uniref:FBP domain-containing protein n=1 Tax=Protaetiibacter intestinalis TaxID=2419774 RepID=A0A387B4S7_9MICO|nr:FBP domain-containing protein [Protaetiibacter intestinalis]AYF98664.1 FBP domain-containing protein [Protaetiibacter intestinalis]